MNEICILALNSRYFNLDLLHNLENIIIVMEQQHIFLGEQKYRNR